jgi:hypothetical protein
MSRNRCDSSCQCRFWSFDDERELPEGSEGLMTFEAYLRKTGMKDGDPWMNNSGHGWGYGYRDDLHGYRSHQYLRSGETNPNNRSWTNGPLPPGAIILAEHINEPVPEEKRYMVRYLECPLCQAKFAGWYRAQVGEVTRHRDGRVETKPITYELYDTSYWHSFNDEPASDGSDRAKRSITPEVVRDALAAYFSKEST